MSVCIGNIVVTIDMCRIRVDVYNGVGEITLQNIFRIVSTYAEWYIKSEVYLYRLWIYRLWEKSLTDWVPLYRTTFIWILSQPLCSCSARENVAYQGIVRGRRRICSLIQRIGKFYWLRNLYCTAVYSINVKNVPYV